MPYFENKNREPLFYREIGQGKPCILLHGFGQDSRSWLPFVLPFSNDYRFILPDLRGYGKSKSAALEESCALSQFAEDLSCLIEQIGDNDIILGGYSLGAATALQYHKLFGFDRISKYLHIEFPLKFLNEDSSLQVQSPGFLFIPYL